MESLLSTLDYGEVEVDNMRWLTAASPSARLLMTAHRDQDLIDLEELIAGLAHELNNPLSVIAGQALMLQETAGDAGTAKRARMIGRAADRSARIIKSILAMARKDPVDICNVNMNQVIHDALKVRETALLASSVRISLCLEESLPLVRGDAGQLGQVVANLLINAQQAMEETSGPRHLEVISTYCRQNRQVVVKVIDNGPGIHPAIRPHIFEPFVTSKDVGVGTGIGLALSRRIMEAHDGLITFETEQDEGTVFAIHFPVKPVSDLVP